MSAADHANDQDRELAVVTAERDDLQLRLDEAEAVIDAVRRTRKTVEGLSVDAASHWRREGDHWDLGFSDGCAKAAALLDQVDGL